MNELLKNKIQLARAVAARIAPYWAMELSALYLVEDASIPTAATSKGWVTYLSPDAAKLEPEELATVLLHEMMHLWQRHFERLPDGVDPGTWNIAGDMEINDDLRSMGCKFPSVWPGVFPETYGCAAGDVAEEYLVALLSKQTPPNPVPACGSCAGNAAGCEGAEGAAPGGFEARSEAEKAALGARLQSNLEQAIKSGSAGNIPGSMKIRAERLGQPPKVDWRKATRSAIRRAITFERGYAQNDWSRFGRRNASRFLTPRTVQPKINVLVALDTSGSMRDVLNAALVEVTGVIKALKASITLVQADTKIQEVKTIKSVDNLEFKGLGGTCFHEVFEYVNKLPARDKPSVVVYLTDGYGSAPANPPPGIRVIWGLIGGTRAPASWGEAIVIEED